MNNLKLLGMCVEFYKMDYNGWYPASYTTPSIGTLYWVHRLKPYFARAGVAPNYKSGTVESIITCPSRYYTTSKVWSNWWNPPTNTQWFHCHYGINGSVCVGLVGKNESYVTKPATTLLLFEYGWYNDTAWDHLRVVGGASKPDGWFGYMQGVCPHNDGMNVLWCDGHASWQSKNSLKDSMFTGAYTGN